MRRTQLFYVVSLLAAACADAAVIELEHDAPPAEFSSDGLRFTPLYKNRSDRFELKTVAPKDVRDEAQIDHTKLSDEEFADRLTGFTELHGYVYRVKPEFDLIRELRSKSARVIQPGIPAAVDLTTDVEEGTVASYIIADGRDWVKRRDNTTYPMSSIVQADNGALGCTGVMIGQSTLLSASHCFFDGRYFRDPYVFRPGTDAEDGDSWAPFGEWGCYGIWAAGGGLNDVTTDYAVIDFRYLHYGCDDRPGNAGGGWMGTKTISDSALRAKTAHLHGYPTFLEPYPQLWGMTGSFRNVYARHLEYDMDEEDGHSGAPVYYFEPGDPSGYVAGINSGGLADWGTVVNRGPRYTVDTWYAIQSWSREY